MATRGTALLAVGLASALLGATGCLDTDRPQSRESTPGPSPTVNQAREDLLQALRRTEGASVRFTVRGSMPEGQRVQATGASDPKGRRYEAKIKLTGGKHPSDTHQIVVDKHYYMRSPGDPSWVHLDLSRVKKDGPYNFDLKDATGLVEFGSSIGSVRETGPHAYRGRFNPEGGTDPFLPLGAPSLVSFGMTIADFTATTDDKGWVTSITVELEPGDRPRVSITTTLSGHGTKLSIKAPPKAQVQEADDVYYEK
jgi:hypothetical protein